MKVLVVILLSLFLASCSFLAQQDEKNVQYKYGYVGFSGCEKLRHADGYPIKRGECEEIKVINETESIQMNLGVVFGIDYMIFDLDDSDCYTITHKLTHPEMTTPKGKRSSYFRNRKAGKCIGEVGSSSGVFSWYIEAEWEAIKGNWEFEILLDGKPVIKKIITAI